MTSAHIVEILLVEDNAGDIELTREALAESKMANRLNVVQDGVEAIKYLRREAPYREAPVPDIILLDLNLPRKDGREVLAELKDDPVLRLLPVVVLTSSEADEDILKAYQHHANCYIRKPIDFQRFMDVIKKIEDFWFSIVKLPPKIV